MTGRGSVVLVVGTGRSGTSLLAGIVRELGFAVPQPELVSNETNPRGFNEPRWVVGFHKRLMEQEHVHTLDSRPGAIKRAEQAGRDEAVGRQLRNWLAGQLREHDRLVIKDPRIGYFLGLWRRCAHELGIEVTTLSMLRHPAEILDSLERAYGSWQSPASRLAAWLNMTLHVERDTRKAPRAFVRHTDLMTDWRTAVYRAGAAAGLESLRHTSAKQEEQVNSFLEPGLWRSTTSWDDITVPVHLRRLAASVWDDVSALADEGGGTSTVLDRLDRSRREYRQLYRDAQEIAQLSIVAARRQGMRAAAKEQELPTATPAAGSDALEPAERVQDIAARERTSVIGRVSARFRRAMSGSTSK